MKIDPVDRSWVHTYVFEPYLQGAELFNLAWKGIDRTLEEKPLSLMNRSICWLQGLALSIPLINTIFWIAWQTFGIPERLADPFCPEIEMPDEPQLPQIRIHPVEDPREEEGIIEQFLYAEQGENNNLVSWMIEKFPTVTFVHQNGRDFSSSSQYDKEHALKEFHYQNGPKKIGITVSSPDKVLVEVASDAQTVTTKTLQIPEPHAPLIQQRIGLKPFILSEKQEIDFFSVFPEFPAALKWLPFVENPPFLMKVKATKKGIEEVPGMGRLLKVEVAPIKLPYSIFKSELWFDPETAVLRKFCDSGLPFMTKTGALVQNNR